MEKRRLGKTELMVTPIGFGVLTVGNTQLNLPVKKGAEILRYALERGINFLDTAQYYETYPYIKEALQGTNHEPVIASKCLGESYDQMAYAIEEARREIHRDVIDIFLLHEVRHNQDFEKRAGAWACLNDAKAKGLIRAIGVSTHHVDVVQQMVEIQECDVLFPLLNFKGLGIRKGSGIGTKEEMEQAIIDNGKKGCGIFLMKAFGGGNLTDSYQKALNYVFGIPDISSVMVGFGSIQEVDDIFDYWEGRMPECYNPDVSHKKIHIDQGDCEGCGLCVLRCPNHAIFVNDKGLSEINYEKCLTCGYCAPQCPVRAIIMW
jgi:predicted aldo/keto reductase-like oxidoreductase